MGWIEGALLGTVATSVAVIAVAMVGLMMLAGRASLRRGLTVVLGCFILFGASAIANGIRTAAGEAPAGATRSPPPPAPLSPPPATPPVPANADPYAGAAVPGR